jgi:NADH:ubiquinone oxidoreductase 24 kD subunit
MNEFKRLIGIDQGGTTPDMKFSLEYSRCLGYCRRPPVISINGRVYDDVTIEDVPVILEKCK